MLEGDSEPEVTLHRMYLCEGLETYPIFVYPVPLSMTSGAWRDIVLDAFSELIPRCRLELYAYSMLQ